MHDGEGIIMFFKRLPLTLLALVAAFTGEVRAESLVEPDYDGTGPKLTTPWFGNYSAANQKSDMDFIIGMRPHHAGALTMSEDYLASSDKKSRRLQDLARGIIRNQTFEILMLDTVEGHVKDIEFAGNQPEWHQIATGRLAKRERFMRAPIPSSILKNDPSSAEDVRFAKAMIVHHEGALIMCEGYLSNPDTNNTYVERMCLDILRDQAQEIALMQAVINDYPGDADAIIIDPSMVHGMEGMSHGSHHSGHAEHKLNSGHGHHQE
jgi:uncharacterized protein (DUF305 family)